MKDIDNKEFSYLSGTNAIWNTLDIFSSGLVVAFSVMVMVYEEPKDWVFIVGSLAVVFLWLKTFYFFKISLKVSAYIRMIVQIILDIRIFLFLFFVGILAFANSFYILDLYSDVYKENVYQPGDSVEGDKITGNNYLQSISYVYLLALGEFEADGFNDSLFPNAMWFFFTMASLFLQLTLLNLLIAIMGDTYDYVQEMARVAKTKEILNFIGDYQNLLRKEDFAQSSAIFYVSPAEGAEG